MSKLYLVPTPIGNLEDITLRAIRILKEVDLVLAEDTRTSGFLLRHLEISKPLMAFHMHNEHKVTDMLVQRLQKGETMALVSDAGTPGISDPGFMLARACVEAGIDIECLPGPTAFVPALVNSGLPCERFVFEGFLPQKKGRQTRLKSLVTEERTLVIYESPHRLVKSLSELAEYFGADRRASVSRELTKLHEETQRGTLTELAEYFSKQTVKGEIVMCVEGAKIEKKKGNKYESADNEEEDSEEI
jgi:16S rRNA (cytidine1402-2'-O)-methyltransferase